MIGYKGVDSYFRVSKPRTLRVRGCTTSDPEGPRSILVDIANQFMAGRTVSTLIQSKVSNNRQHVVPSIAVTEIGLPIVCRGTRGRPAGKDIPEFVLIP